MFHTISSAPAVARRCAVAACLSTVLIAPGGLAFAADPPLTLARAQQLAVDQSRLVNAKDYAAQSARDMAVAAEQLPDPVLKVGIDNLPVNKQDRFSLTRDFMTMRRVGLMQELTGSDKRRLRAERFEGEADKSLAEKSVVAAAVERDTALAWLDRYYADAVSALIAEQIAQARLEVQWAQSAYRGGKGSQADIFVARSALAALEDQASDSDRRAGSARIALARWIGDAAQLPLGAKPPVDTVSIDEANLETQLGHHPELAVLARQEAIANTEARLAQANKKADWTVEVAFQKRGDMYSDMLSVGLSVPLQWGQKNRQDRELSAKLSQAEQAKAEREDALRAHVAEVRAMLNEWHADRLRQARYADELTPLAGSRTAAIVAAYRGGKATLADVLTARRAEIDLRLQALRLEQETDRLWAQLNFLFPRYSAMKH